MPSSDVVFGIDPGTHRCGWGAVTRSGNRFTHVAHGVVTAPRNATLAERLVVIADGLGKALAETRATTVAIESVFFHRDAQAALTLGHARGVAMLVAGRAGLAVHEYPPAMVKRTVTGRGRAEKDQVAAMVRAFLGLTSTPAADAADALAVAICHASGSSVHAALAGRTGSAGA